MSGAPTLTVDAPSAKSTAAPSRVGAFAWAALIALCVIVLMTTVDRQIWMLQSEVIRKHMQLSDLQLGLLQGRPSACACVALRMADYGTALPLLEQALAIIKQQ